VRRNVKGIRNKLTLNTKVHHPVGVKKNRPQHALLGLFAVRKNPAPLR
jgi:hypothetical protein